MAADNIIEFLIKGDASSANKAFGSLNSAVSGLTKVLGALGVAYGGLEIVKFIRRQIDVADQMLKIHQRTGVTTETLSQLNYVFGLNDQSAQDMENSFKFLNKSIEEARTGNRAALQSYESLGISIEDLQNLSPDEVFLRVADAVSQIEDPVKRNAILLDKFGRSGLGVAPMMEEGRVGIEKLMKQADALGLTVDKKFGQEADRFNDNLTTIGQAAAGTARQIASAMLPVLNETIEALFDFGDTGEDSILPWGKIFVTTIGTVAQAIIALKAMISGIADAVAGSFQAVGGMLGSLAAAAEQTLAGDFKGALATVEEGWADMGAITSETLTKIDGELQSSADSINRLTVYMNEYGEEVKATGEATAEAAKHKIDPVSKEAAQRLLALEQQQQDYLSNVGKMNAAATGNKLALLDTEYEQQIRQITDLQFRGEEAVRAKVAVDQWYAEQRLALQDQMLAELGISDGQYRERQIELAETTAARMVELGLSQTQADQFVNSTILNQQLAFLQARNSMVNEDYLSNRELAELRYEEEALRLRLALETEALTRAEFTEYMAQAEIEKQARLGNIIAQAEANRIKVSKMSLDGQLKYTADSLGSISALMQSESKTQFVIGKAAAVAQATIAAYTSAVNAYQSASAIPIVGWVLGPIAAAAALALGIANVNKIRSTQFTGQAHDGMTSIPQEGTYLLDRGERVVQPEQNRDLTNFLNQQDGEGGGGVQIGSLTVAITVPNGEALRGMTRREWEDLVSDKIVPAFNTLDRKGIRPDFVQRYDR